MTRLLLALTLTACITTAGIIKRHDEVTLPVFIGTAIADLVGAAVIAKEAGGLSTGASIAVAIPVTALDAVVACLIAPCPVRRQ